MAPKRSHACNYPRDAHHLVAHPVGVAALIVAFVIAKKQEKQPLTLAREIQKEQEEFARKQQREQQLLEIYRQIPFQLTAWYQDYWWFKRTNHKANKKQLDAYQRRQLEIIRSSYIDTMQEIGETITSNFNSPSG